MWEWLAEYCRQVLGKKPRFNYELSFISTANTSCLRNQQSAIENCNRRIRAFTNGEAVLLQRLLFQGLPCHVEAATAELLTGFSEGAVFSQWILFYFTGVPRYVGVAIGVLLVFLMRSRISTTNFLFFHLLLSHVGVAKGVLLTGFGEGSVFFQWISLMSVATSSFGRG